MTRKLLLVDDSDVYRSTLELLLGREPGLEVVAVAPDAETALRLCDEHEVDVVLLDYRLPDADGASVTASIVASHPHVTVVCLTAEASEEERTAVLAAGAAAVVEKGDLAELVEEIHSAASRR